MPSDAPPSQQRRREAEAEAGSPGPPPTTASAAPDVRARHLQFLFAAALEATLGRVSYGNFAACFPTVAAHRPDTLRRFHADFVKRLGEQCTVSPPSCSLTPPPTSGLEIRASMRWGGLCRTG
jgi:kinetochore protein NNF1